MLAIFRNPTPTSPRKREAPGNVYFAIALTTLSVRSGISRFFPHEHIGAKAEVLEPGDGIICLGEDVNPHGDGEGGIVFMIRYQLEAKNSC